MVGRVIRVDGHSETFTPAGITKMESARNVVISPSEQFFDQPDNVNTIAIASAATVPFGARDVASCTVNGKPPLPNNDWAENMALMADTRSSVDSSVPETLASPESCP